MGLLRLAVMLRLLRMAVALRLLRLAVVLRLLTVSLLTVSLLTIFLRRSTRALRLALRLRGLRGVGKPSNHGLGRVLGIVGHGSPMSHERRRPRSAQRSRAG